MKNCPFCGTKSNLQRGLLRIVCLNCGASGPVGLEPESLWEDRKYPMRLRLLSGGVPISLPKGLDVPATWQVPEPPFPEEEP